MPCGLITFSFTFYFVKNSCYDTVLFTITITNQFDWEIKLKLKWNENVQRVAVGLKNNANVSLTLSKWVIIVQVTSQSNLN